MKKILIPMFLLVIALAATIVILIERYPDTWAGKELIGFYGEHYVTARAWTLAKYDWVRVRVDGFRKERSQSADSPAAPAPAVESPKAKVDPVKPSPAPEKSVATAKTNEVHAAVKEAPTLDTAKWFTGDRIRIADLRDRAAVVCVWSDADDETAELLGKAQRIWDAFSTKKLVVFASHRGGVADKAEVARIRKFLQTNEITIPVNEGAGHPAEIKRRGTGPVLYLVDRRGKVKYIGRDDKPILVRLSEML